MPRRSHPGQFDLFPAPTEASGPASQREDEERPPEPPADEELMPAPEDKPYRPTDAEERETFAQEHGGAQLIPSKSRKEREAQRRRTRAMMDDALGRMGEPGKQLLTDAESPFARGQRDTAERRKRAEEERRRRKS